jgi:hypothetical protein
MPSSGMWRHVNLVKANVSEGRVAFWHEDGGDTFLRNGGFYKTQTALHRREHRTKLKSHILPTQRIYMFHMVLIVNSDNFPKQH